MLKQLVFQSALDDIYRHFRKLKIRYMPIKGAYLLLCGLADKSVNRTMMDIDILVEEKDFKNISEYFLNLDNTTPLHDEWKFETPFYYRINKVVIKIELHSRLNRPERFNLPTEKLFSQAIKYKDFLYLPSPEDAMIIHICHTLVHIAYRFRDDIYDDIHLISLLDNFSWSEFYVRAQNTGVVRFIEFVLRLYEDEKNVKLEILSKINFLQIFYLFMFKKTYEKLPTWGKRIFFEITFVRHPVKLIIMNIFK